MSPNQVGTKLSADGAEISLNTFTQATFRATLFGLAGILRGAPTTPASLDLVVSGEGTRLTVDGADLELNEYVARALKEVALGLVRSLRDTPASPDALRIQIGA